MEQFTTVGFAYVTNVPEWDEQEHFKMVKAFHSLPDHEKKLLHMTHFNSANKNWYRGMAPFLPNDPSHKELFDMGWPYENIDPKLKKYPTVQETPFPQGQEFAYLKAAYEKHYKLFNELSLRLSQYLAMGLGKPRTFFDAWF